MADYSETTDVGSTPTSSEYAEPAGQGLDHPLRPICDKWLKLIAKAEKHKKAQFSDDAAEAMRFFNGPYDFMYEKEYREKDASFRVNDTDAGPLKPGFEMSANVVSEMVQIFGPSLYHRNPDRLANPRNLPDLPQGVLADPNDPMAAQMEQQLQQQLMGQQTRDETRAKFLEWVLNYTPTELDLKRHSRMAIDETIIKGMGVLVTETYKAPGSDIELPGSFYVSVDRLQIDPDAEDRAEAQWSSIEYTRPAWELEREWGYEPGTLKAHIESYSQQASVDTDKNGDYDRKRGDTNDLITFHKVFSKMGLGGRLKDAPDELKETLEQFGDYCYLLVAKDVPFPINLHPKLINAPADQPVDEDGMPMAMPSPDLSGIGGMIAEGMEQQEPPRTVQDEIFSRLEWPTPFWMDDEWPWTDFVFHEVPRHLWPMSHLKPALGYVKFLNWAYSFLASKIRITCRDFLAMKKSAGEDLKARILHGQDLTLLELCEADGSIADMVAFIQHAPINKDMFEILAIIQHQFERATGLTELMYGAAGNQLRSAEEAKLRGNYLQVRPDDMADKVEEGMTRIARKEALCWRWHDTTNTVKTLMGEAAATVWQSLVMTQDPFAITHQLEYRIEAGSTRKPNRDKQSANLEQAMTSLFQPLFAYAQGTGQLGPLNALLIDWCTANGFDGEKYAFTQPPAPEEPPPQGPSPEELAAQEAEMNAQIAAQEAQMKAQVQAQEVQMKAQAQAQQLQQQAQESQQRLRQNEQLHDQKIRHLEEKQAVALKLAKEKAAETPKPKKKSPKKAA